MEFLFIIIGLLLILLLGKALHISVEIILKLFINGLVGGLTLIAFNFIGAIFNINIKINAINALIAGFFGLPGVVLMILIKYLI